MLASLDMPSDLLERVQHAERDLQARLRPLRRRQLAGAIEEAQHLARLLGDRPLSAMDKVVAFAAERLRRVAPFLDPAKAIEVEIGGGRRPLRLGLLQVFDLEAETGRGLYALYKATSGPDWTVQDTVRVLRHALIGAGMRPGLAGDIVRSHVEGKALAELAKAAGVILAITLFGPPDEPE